MEECAKKFTIHNTDKTAISITLGGVPYLVPAAQALSIEATCENGIILEATHDADFSNIKHGIVAKMARSATEMCMMFADCIYRISDISENAEIRISCKNDDLPLDPFGLSYFCVKGEKCKVELDRINTPKKKKMLRLMIFVAVDDLAFIRHAKTRKLLRRKNLFKYIEKGQTL